MTARSEADGLSRTSLGLYPYVNGAIASCDMIQIAFFIRKSEFGKTCPDNEPSERKRSAVLYPRGIYSIGLGL